jgi:hypothetical protein
MPPVRKGSWGEEGRKIVRYNSQVFSYDNAEVFTRRDQWHCSNLTEQFNSTPQF